jgi:hypothetical protein
VFSGIVTPDPLDNLINIYRIKQINFDLHGRVGTPADCATMVDAILSPNHRKDAEKYLKLQIF